MFAASRYDRGEADYLNCPFNKAEYEAFHAALAGAERAPLHDFDTGAEQSAKPDPDAHGKKADTVTVYEGCMPIEIMAARGADTMRFGPLRPVGLVDPTPATALGQMCSCAQKIRSAPCITSWASRQTSNGVSRSGCSA